MVRIAVRTITLNIFKVISLILKILQNRLNQMKSMNLFLLNVFFNHRIYLQINDEMLSKYVHAHSQKYFDKVCTEIAFQIIDMDTFARSAQNEQSNRTRLSTMMDMHLDNIHYLNDILMVGNENLVTKINKRVIKLDN